MRYPLYISVMLLMPVILSGNNVPLMDTLLLEPAFDTICFDEPFIEARVVGDSYAWNTGQLSRQISAPAPGTYVVTITNSDTIVVDRHEVTVIIVPDPVFPIPDHEGPYCDGEEITYSVSIMGYDSIQWNDGRGTIVPGFGPSNSMATFTFEIGQGVSYIAYYSRCGEQLTVLPPLPFREEDAAPFFSGSLLPESLENICTGQMIDLSFNGIGYERLVWEDGTTDPERTIITDPTTDYFVTVYPFCSMDSVVFRPQIIFTDTAILVSILPTTGICFGDEVELSIAGDDVSAVLWEDGTTGLERTITADSAITYGAIVDLGCGTSRQLLANLDYSENCETENCTAAIPELITPNGDGTNDFFRLFTGCDVSDYKLQVFNRWGQIVFSSNDNGQGWDGTKNGVAQNTDTYLYLVQFRLAEGELEERDGQFYLIR